MHPTDAIKIATLGTNIIIGTDSSLHYTDALSLIEVVISNGGHVIIEKKYHHQDIEKMVKLGGKNITVKI